MSTCKNYESLAEVSNARKRRKVKVIWLTELHRKYWGSEIFKANMYTKLLFLPCSKEVEREKKESVRDRPKDDAKFYASSSKIRDVTLRLMVKAFRQGSGCAKTSIQEWKLMEMRARIRG